MLRYQRRGGKAKESIAELKATTGRVVKRNSGNQGYSLDCRCGVFIKVVVFYFKNKRHGSNRFIATSREET